MKTQRPAKPVAGHKCLMVKTCFETHCECGRASFPHWERRAAYSEWREHPSRHGGQIVWVDDHRA